MTVALPVHPVLIPRLGEGLFGELSYAKYLLLMWQYHMSHDILMW